MTRGRAIGSDFALLDYIRKNPRLDSLTTATAVSDFDLIIHNFRDERDGSRYRRTENIIVVEVKTHQRSPRRMLPKFMEGSAQDDTWWCLDRILSVGASGRVKTGDRAIPLRAGPEVRYIRWRGVHLLQLSGDRPENSAALFWDGEPITVEQLDQLFLFEIEPRTLKRSDLRYGHHPKASHVLPFLEKDESG